MIVAETIARLRALDPPAFRLVAGAVELAAIGKQPPATPAAYVVIEQEAAGENDYVAGVLRQRVEADLAVVVVAANASDATGAALALDIEALKRRVRDALLGWTPPSGDDAITYVGCEIARAAPGYAVAQLTFSAPYYVEATP